MDKPRLTVVPSQVPAGPEVVTSEGKVGAPTPTERREIYLQELRKGGPPPGWGARMAKRWGLAKGQVYGEIASVREDLSSTRTPDAAATQAHELIQQVIETAAEIDRDAILINEPEKRAKTRALAAGLKLKAATELRNLYRKSSGLASEVAALMSGSPPALTDDALKG